MDRGNFLDAENMYLQALELYQSIDCTQGIADENRNLGLTYQNLAQSERSNQEKRTYYDKAEKCYQNALENHISLSDEYGIAIDYLNLGQLSGIRENYDEAEIKLENAIGRFEKLQKKIPLAKCYFNLGLVFFYRGDNENAKNNLITAMEIYKSILGNDNTPRISVEIASCFDFLCQVDQKDEEWQSAKENCIKALDYFKQANNFIKVREMEKRLDSLEDKI